MVPASVNPPSERLPLKISTRQALVAIYAIQTWDHARTPEGRNYSAGYFINKRGLWEPALRKENRRTSLRLARQPCIVCGEALSENSTGDHIIPLSKGGPQGATNYLPLCKSHNSSKGAKDLFEWWQSRGLSVRNLPLDVLCSYSRLLYQWSMERHLLDWPAPNHLVDGLVNLIESKPYDVRLYWYRELMQPGLPQ